MNKPNLVIVKAPPIRQNAVSATSKAKRVYKIKPLDLIQAEFRLVDRQSPR